MFQGSMVALVTPMSSDGAVDYASLADLIRFHCERGTDAIVSVGTTGESATLTVDEHADVIKNTVDLVAGRIPVIAGTGANSTSEAIELTRAAEQVGADACLLVSPYYNRPTQEGLYQHHKKIAESVAIPQILYNVPSRTAVDMLPETVARLSYIDNIIGIKEATGDIARAKQILDLTKDRLELYSGDDITALECMLAGAVGNISVTANIVPEAMHQLCVLATTQRQVEAEQLDQSLQELHRSLFFESNPIPVKWALSAMGLIDNGIRLPLTPLAEAYHQPLREILKRMKVLA